MDYNGVIWTTKYLISRHIISKQIDNTYSAHSHDIITCIISWKSFIHVVVYFPNYEVPSVSNEEYVNRKSYETIRISPFSLRIWSILQIIPKKLWFQHEINLSNIIHYLTCNQWSYVCKICKLYPLKSKCLDVSKIIWNTILWVKILNSQYLLDAFRTYWE